jgi:hypothetical protein
MRSRSTSPSRDANGTGPSPATPEPDAIAARAYELYLARGGQLGSDLDDWLQAEREISARR